MDAEEKAATLRHELADARAALRRAPVKQTDSLATRLALFLPLGEEHIRQLQPLLVPVALSFLSSLFFSVWSRLDFPEMLTPPNTIMAHATAFAPDVLDEWANAPSRLIAPPAMGSVAEFLADALDAEPGAMTDIEPLPGLYKDWCSAKGFTPMGEGAFAAEVARIAKKAGLLITRKGGRLYCMNMRLVA